MALGALVVVALGCSDDEDPNAPTGEAVLEVGDDLETSTAGVCLKIEESLGPEVSELPRIDCTLPHTHEIFAAVDDTEHDVYPGMAELEQFAERTCYGEFEPYVGISPFDSELFVTWLVPSVEGWNDEKDREVLCVLGRRDGGEMKQSARNSEL